MGKTQGAAVRMYQITYIMGFCLGTILYLLVNKIFPPEGLGISEDFNHESGIVEGIEGVAESLGSQDGVKILVTKTNISDELKA